jgi:hypothetical protein
MGLEEILKQILVYPGHSYRDCLHQIELTGVSEFDFSSGKPESWPEFAPGFRVLVRQDYLPD